LAIPGRVAGVARRWYWEGSEDGGGRREVGGENEGRLSGGGRRWERDIDIIDGVGSAEEVKVEVESSSSERGDIREVDVDVDTERERGAGISLWNMSTDGLEGRTKRTVSPAHLILQRL
jgi:hypothetical protein